MQQQNNNIYVVVDGNNGDVSILGGNDLHQTQLVYGDASSTSGKITPRLSFQIAMWALSLVVVVSLFIILNCYWRRFYSTRGTINDANGSGTERNNINRNHVSVVDPEKKKERREMKKKSSLLNDMTARRMIWTVSGNVAPNTETDTACPGVVAIGDLEEGTCIAASSPGDKADESSKDERNEFQQPQQTSKNQTLSSLLFSNSATTSMLCAICLDEYQPGDEIVRSCHPDCDHIFHCDCLLDTFVKQRRRHSSSSTIRSQQMQGTSAGGDGGETMYPCPCCRRPYFYDDDHQTRKDAETVKTDNAVVGADSNVISVDSGEALNDDNASTTTTSSTTTDEESNLDSNSRFHEHDNGNNENTPTGSDSDSQHDIEGVISEL